jgi:hypothetical protein
MLNFDSNELDVDFVPSLSVLYVARSLKATNDKSKKSAGTIRVKSLRETHSTGIIFNVLRVLALQFSY